ncbi:hypothetical protein BJ508DRAFT_324418 [Ascobolus immersus RN42]|uniref:MYND-type domain-containing protein n=1 Tax=Ascobolus immersus RN42 TaxID=1160509 RepID=A0A3N4IDS6_ASCIM|nr:hypothetical protein BJ508DRAFT_324418 [Ascobolus immersus RN42]
MPTQTFCNLCGADCTKTCAACHETKYCGKECQATDWPTHKFLCKPYTTTFSDDARSDPEFRRFIYFPATQPKPEFVWLSTDPKSFTLAISSLLNSNTICLVEEVITVHPARETSTLPYKIILRSKKPPPSDSTTSEPFNQSLLSTLTPHLPGRLRYNSLLASATSLSGDPLDLNPSDLPSILYHIITDGADPLTGASSIPHIPAVKITCRGDQLRLSEPPFLPISLPITHPIFSSPHPPPSQILQKIGLPLLTHRLPPHPTWSHETHISGLSSTANAPASTLHLDIDPGSPSFGLPPIAWQENVGSVLVVREDHVPISATQVEMLCGFAEVHVLELCRKYMGTYGEEARIGWEVVEGEVTEDGLRRWVGRWNREHGEEEWVRVPHDDVLVKGRGERWRGWRGGRYRRRGRRRRWRRIRNVDGGEDGGGKRYWWIVRLNTVGTNRSPRRRGSIAWLAATNSIPTTSKSTSETGEKPSVAVVFCQTCQQSSDIHSSTAVANQNDSTNRRPINSPTTLFRSARETFVGLSESGNVFTAHLLGTTETHRVDLGLNGIYIGPAYAQNKANAVLVQNSDLDGAGQAYRLNLGRLCDELPGIRGLFSSRKIESFSYDKPALIVVSSAILSVTLSRISSACNVGMHLADGLPVLRRAYELSNFVGTIVCFAILVEPGRVGPLLLAALEREKEMLFHNMKSSKSAVFTNTTALAIISGVFGGDRRVIGAMGDPFFALLPHFLAAVYRQSIALRAPVVRLIRRLHDGCMEDAPVFRRGKKCCDRKQRLTLTSFLWDNSLFGREGWNSLSLEEIANESLTYTDELAVVARSEVKDRSQAAMGTAFGKEWIAHQECSWISQLRELLKGMSIPN